MMGATESHEVISKPLGILGHGGQGVGMRFSEEVLMWKS